MDVGLRCPACGGDSSADERAQLAGLCPGCLARLALGGAGEGEDDEPLRPGAIFRGLEIVRLRGRGGMSLLYEARHLGLDAPRAVKILRPALAVRPALCARFEREGRTLAALDHPRIVRVTDSGRERGLRFIAMELVPGGTLGERLRAGRLSPARAGAVAAQVCEALAAVHERGLVHGDVKPDNVLLDAAGDVKLADFGLATRAGTPAEPGVGTPATWRPSGARPAA